MIMRVCVRSWAIKGKNAGIGGQVALVPLLPKNPSQKQHSLLMSADHNMPLFEISDSNEIEYEDNPAIAQAKANLTAVEQIQQERAK